MNAARIILTTLVFGACTASGIDDGLIAIHQFQKFDGSGESTDIMIEYFAKPADIDASRDWNPYSKELPAPLTKVIETAYANLKIPGDKSAYVVPPKFHNAGSDSGVNPFSPPPDLRGIDLRRLSNDLWCWEVHFGVSRDRSTIDSQVIGHDGQLLLSVKVLPNGGPITIRERKMNEKERITYGLERDPDAKDPFRQ